MIIRFEPEHQSEPVINQCFPVIHFQLQFRIEWWICFIESSFVCSHSYRLWPPCKRMLFHSRNSRLVWPVSRVECVRIDQRGQVHNEEEGSRWTHFVRVSRDACPRVGRDSAESYKFFFFFLFLLDKSNQNQLEVDHRKGMAWLEHSNQRKKIAESCDQVGHELWSSKPQWNILWNRRERQE